MQRDVLSGGGRRRSLRPDPEVVARTAVALLDAPRILWKKARRVARNPIGHFDEIDPARWLCRVLPGPVEARPRRDAPHVVFVGKSFGELRLVERLDEALKASRPGVRTTWCGQMPEFFASVRRRHPRQPTAPIPFAVAPAVGNWLGRVRPDLVVFVERLSHPLLVRGCAAAGVRLVGVNVVAPTGEPRGRLRRRFEAWSRRRTAAAFESLCFQSEEQAERARPSLSSGTRCVVTGNLKLDLRAPAPPDSAALGPWLGGSPDPLFVAGSTRRGDEAFVLEAFLEMRRDVRCRLLVAPRQRERVPEIEALLLAARLSVSRRTRPARADSDVLLLDTMGELPGAYAHAAAAFVGGTLRHLGQNPVEPLLYGVPVSFGPARVLMEEEHRAAAAAGVGVRVCRPTELAAHWREVAARPSYRRRVKEEAAAFLAEHRGALQRTIDVVVTEVDALAGRPRPAAPDGAGDAGTLARPATACS